MAQAQATRGGGTAASGLLLIGAGVWLLLQTIVGGLPDRILKLRAGSGKKTTPGTGNPVFPTEPPTLTTPAGPGVVSGTPAPLPGGGLTVPPPPSGKIPSTPPAFPT